jgi:Flp pilus assembly protein TadG
MIIRSRDDRGSALVEFVFLAFVMLIPLVYLVIVVATIERGDLAVTQAAREAGRAFATGRNTDDGVRRAQASVRLTLINQGLDPASAEIRYVAADRGCSAPPIRPRLQPGAVFLLCVRRTASLPGVPAMVGGRPLTTVGHYLVHVDDYRTDTS